MKTEGGEAFIYDRCPSYSPGNELKCTAIRGHEGLCCARRHGHDGYVIKWEFRAWNPPAIPERPIAAPGVAEDGVFLVVP